MGRRIHIVFWLALAFLATAGRASAVVRAGIGYSTITSGRQIPALELGLDISGWAVSGMLAGARTKAYYTSGAMLNVMRTADWGEFWFGRLEVGFGAGAFHSEKGIYTAVGDDGTLKKLEKDQDNGVGPAFRVAFKPFERVHISVEYLMGVGVSIISNAYEDVGMGAIGVDL